MGMGGYPQYLPGVMKLLNNYITKSENNRNFRSISGKDQTGVAFTTNQEKDTKDKKNTNSNGEYHCFCCINQVHRTAECPDLGK